MKRILYFLLCTSLVFLIVSCGGGKKKLILPDSTLWTDQDIPLDEISKGNVNTDSIVELDQMKAAFSPADSLIEGRPVSYYLSRNDISKTARDFYLLKFIPSNDDATIALCDSLITKNDTTRPFYFFLFMRIMRIADGGLAEGIAEPAQNYVLQYPEDFFKRIAEPMYKQYYDDWVSDVAYDFTMPNNSSPSPQDIQNYIVQEQEKHLRHLTPELKMKIEKFAADVVKHS